jgi:hypothetical protein
LSREDVAVLKDAVFTEDILKAPVMDFSSLLVTFRGTPTASATETMRQAQRRLSLVPGMSDRLRILCLPEYRLDNGAPTTLGAPIINTTELLVEKFSGIKYEPVYVVVPTEAVPKSQGSGEYALGFATFVATIITSFLYSTDVLSLNTDFLQVNGLGNRPLS